VQPYLSLEPGDLSLGDRSALRNAAFAWILIFFVDGGEIGVEAFPALLIGAEHVQHIRAKLITFSVSLIIGMKKAKAFKYVGA
jgi:hypothetical protein